MKLLATLRTALPEVRLSVPSPVRFAAVSTRRVPENTVSTSPVLI